MTDAERTIRSAILDGIAREGPITHRFTSPEVERLIDAIYASISAPQVRWALRELPE